MSTVSTARLRRVARKPPRYLAWRLAQELRQAGRRRSLARAARGRGPLVPSRIVPGGSAAAITHAAALGAWPAAVAATREDAALRAEVERRRDAALARRVELFGDAPIEAGVPPAWLADAHSGHDWPLGFHRTIDYVNRGRPSDVKVPWELSRMRHLVALAQAAAVLDDDAAEAAIAADLASWIAANPVGWSVNWAVGMEVALRAVNLVCVDGILAAAGRGGAVRPHLTETLYQHGWFLSRNLEIGDLNGNHYLANAVGLIWLGRHFGDLGEAPRWLNKGVEMARTAVAEQVLGDGLDHEGSLPYHVLVLEMFLTALHAARDELAPQRPALARMAGALEAVLAPGGEVPDLGDDDGGRVLAFCDAPSRDGRRVLALAGALLDRPAPAAWPQDALWLTGSRAPAPAAAGAPRPVHLGDGGVAVLGDGDDHVVMDVGPVGFRGRGGHGHLDATSFVAWLGGVPVVRDSGTGTYTRDPALRNRLRDAPAHTVVRLDDRSYARLGGPDALWSVEGDAPPVVLDIAADAITVQQDLPGERGSGRLTRTLRVAAGAVSWTDEVQAPAGTRVAAYVQLTEAAACECSLPFIIAPVEWSDAYGSVASAPRAVAEAVAPVTIEWTVRRR